LYQALSFKGLRLYNTHYVTLV